MNSLEAVFVFSNSSVGSSYICVVVCVHETL